MNLIKKYWVLIFFLILTIAYSYPFLLQGKIPFPSSYVANNLAPWNKYLPHGSIKNGIPDVPGEIYPMRSLVVDFWKNGIVPLWNPYVFSGAPLLANFQSSVLSPLNLLFVVFSKVNAWSILVLLQPILAGIFAYLLAKSLRLSSLASLFSAVSFMFCGYLTVWGSYATMGVTLLFLPLVLLLVEKYFTKFQTRYLPLIPLVLALAFFSGHIQTWTYVFLATLIYGMVRIFTNKKMLKQVQHDNHFIFLLFLSIFLTIPLVAIQLFPTWEFYQLSGRVLAKNSASTVGISFNYLVTLLAPDFYGNPVTRNDWLGTYAEWSGYVGLLTFLLAVLAVSFLKKNKKVWPILGISVLGVILSVQNPLLSFISSLPIPILSNSNPTRAIGLLSFGIVMLAGFGAEEILNNWVKVKRRLLVITIVISVVLIGLLGVTLFGKYFFPEQVALNLRLISLRNLIFPLGILITTWVLLTALWLKPQLRTLIVYCLLFVVVLEMLRFYTKWTPFDAKSSFYAKTPIAEFLNKQGNYYRFYGQFNQSTGYIDHILATDGYEPLNLLSYSEFIAGASNGRLYRDYRLEVKLQSQEKYTKRLLDILGAEYLIFESNDIRNSFGFPFWQYGVNNFPEIFTDGKFTVFENKQTISRPFLFGQYEVITDKDKTLATLLSDDFDYKNILILDTNPSVNVALGTGSAVMKKYTANEIEIETKTNKPSFLFLSDNYYPGWQAYVNGNKTKIFLADFTFRAVVIPSGINSVVFRYEPESFRNGLIVSGITFMLVMLFLVYCYRKKDL